MKQEDRDDRKRKAEQAEWRKLSEPHREAEAHPDELAGELRLQEIDPAAFDRLSETEQLAALTGRGLSADEAREFVTRWREASGATSEETAERKAALLDAVRKRADEVHKAEVWATVRKGLAKDEWAPGASPSEKPPCVTETVGRRDHRPKQKLGLGPVALRQDHQRNPGTWGQQSVAEGQTPPPSHPARTRPGIAVA
jgi:hypothetical protein